MPLELDNVPIHNPITIPVHGCDLNMLRYSNYGVVSLVLSGCSESRTSMIMKRMLHLCALMTETHPTWEAASGSGDYKLIQQCSRP